MNNKKNLSCSTRNLKTPHIYSTGWWVWKKCSHKNNEKKNFNTNKERGEDRGYDAFGAAHSKVAKGSHNQVRIKYR